MIGYAVETEKGFAIETEYVMDNGNIVLSVYLLNCADNFAVGETVRYNNGIWEGAQTRCSTNKLPDEELSKLIEKPIKSKKHRKL